MTDQHMGRRVKRVDELVRDIPPVRDLWPGIAAAIEADRATAAPALKQTPRRTFWLPAAGLAASVLLVAVGVFIGQRIGTQPDQPLARTTMATDAAIIPAAHRRDAEYRKQRDALLVEVQTRLKSMPPADRAKVSASLDTLRKSIGEIEAALGRDPANALLQELLVSSCQEEMRALTAVRDSGREEI